MLLTSYCLTVHNAYNTPKVKKNPRLSGDDIEKPYLLSFKLGSFRVHSKSR